MENKINLELMIPLIENAVNAFNSLKKILETFNEYQDFDIPSNEKAVCKECIYYTTKNKPPVCFECNGNSSFVKKTYL